MRSYIRPPMWKSSRLGVRGYPRRPGTVRWRFLVGSPPQEHDPDRSQNDLEIQPERIVPDVVEIVLGVQVHGPVAAATHLPPASDPLRHRQTLQLPGLVSSDNVGKLGAGSHEAHITP
jgi:hypothetical protein